MIDKQHSRLPLSIILREAASRNETNVKHSEVVSADEPRIWTFRGWRSRWINFLITRGRIPEAHAAWNAAIDALGLPDQDADPRVYESLHLWVARLLVHRGQIDFAEKILRGIPPEVFQEHPGLRAIQRR